MVLPEEVESLVAAMWQLLEDMGKEGQCVCLEAKARARIAFEPFREDDDDIPMTLEDAERVITKGG